MCLLENSSNLTMSVGFPDGSEVKNPAANAGDLGSIPGSGRSPGEGNAEGNSYPFQYPCLENPMDRGVWWAIVYGVTKSRTWLTDEQFLFYFHAAYQEPRWNTQIRDSRGVQFQRRGRLWYSLEKWQVATIKKTGRLAGSHLCLGRPGGSDGKESICNVGDLGSIPGSGRSPGGGNGNRLQYSCLKNSMNRGA